MEGKLAINLSGDNWTSLLKALPTEKKKQTKNQKNLKYGRFLLLSKPSNFKIENF